MDNPDLTTIRQICSLYPEAEEGLLQDRPLFHVRRRRFAIYNWEEAPYRKRWEGAGRSLHFATSEYTRSRLKLDDRFVASPHHGFRGWTSLKLVAETDWNEISELLLSAYRHVANKSLVRRLEGKDEAE